MRNAQNPNSKVGKITANRGKIQALKEGFNQLSPLFYPPYLKQIIVVFSMYFGMLMRYGFVSKAFLTLQF